jgi:endoglucanase
MGRTTRLSRPAFFAFAVFVVVTIFIAPSFGAAFVRVNQVGYPSGASKRAYLMASGTEAGATFTVKNASGTAVYSASIGQLLGSWSSSYRNVYALDFDSVSAPGTYTISVTGPLNANSSSFRIDTGGSVYGGALSNALSYYQNSRDGANYIPSALRTAPAHLHDQTASVYFSPTFDRKDNAGTMTPTGAVIDGSGGWYDAGDYLKFVETHSYTVGILLTGVRDFPNQMGVGSTSSNFTAEAKFGLDWLQKMWDDNSKTLYYQVAVASGGRSFVGDHDIWRLPEADDSYQGCPTNLRFICNRPVLLNPAGGAGAQISPNLAGRLAASFALCYQVFKTSNPPYANQCLLSAEHIFDLANTAPTGNLVTAGPFDFYPETEWRDDMEWGATELYFALSNGGLPTGLPHSDPNFYLPAAASWASAYINGPNDAADTLNLYDVTGVAHYELYRALVKAGNPTTLKVTEATLLADLKKQLDKAVTQAGSDPFGFGFPWAAFDTTSHGAGIAVMAKEYGNLTQTSTYSAFGDRWLGNILGANAWGQSLIVGDGTSFPHCMQHQITNLAGSLDGTPPILAGAAVEGPNKTKSSGLVTGMRTCPANGVDLFSQFSGSNAAFYQDNVQSWSTNEPAIDLTASSPLAFSWEAAGAPAGTP